MKTKHYSFVFKGQHRVILLFGVLTSFTACGDSENKNEDAGPKILTKIPCTIGTFDTQEGFQLLEPNTELELNLGFQGFLFVELAARSEVEIQGRVESLYSVEITSIGEPWGGVQKGLAFDKGSSGNHIGEFLVFFDSADLAVITEQAVEIRVKFESEEYECASSGTAMLVDEDPCIHTDGVPFCP